MCYTTFNNSWKEVRAMTAKPETRSSDPARLTALRARVDALYLAYVFPVLATVRAGEDPADVELETRLLEAAKAVGIRVRRYILPAEISRADVELLIREINADFLLSAALLIEPLPERLDPASLAEMILPKKQIAVPGEPADPLTLLTRVADAAERSAK